MTQNFGLGKEALAKQKFDVYPSAMQTDETKWYKSKVGLGGQGETIQRSFPKTYESGSIERPSRWMETNRNRWFCLGPC